MTTSNAYGPEAPSSPDAASLPEVFVARPGRATRALAWLLSRKTELALFALGVLLRVSMSWSYEPTWAFDFGDHWQVVTWILRYGRLPPVEALRESFHPPLFYVTAAFLTKWGVSLTRLVLMPIICGVIKLALVWAGLEVFVMRSRLARVSALALAAVMSASVHVDGMIHPEALNGLWAAAAMLLAALAFARTGRARWGLCSAAGVVLGIGMLTKISASVIVISLSCAALLEFVFAKRTFRGRVAALLPWAWMVGLCVAVCGWYFARNVTLYHQVFLTSFDLKFEHSMVVDSNKLPYLDRRSLGFFVGWDPKIFLFPYHPSAVHPEPRFFPVAVASTFMDYWNFCFSGLSIAERGGPSLVFSRVVAASRYAVAGGTAIFVATVLAWCFTIVPLFRRRDFARMALLFVPLFTLVSALHFATKYPVDDFGVVKGVYMQFGAPPMFALFGVAVAWTRRSADRWPLFALLVSALWCVTAYTVYCRFRVPLLPLG